MVRWSKPALLLGGSSLLATIAVLVAGFEQPDCRFFSWLIPAIILLQLCCALVAGFVTEYRPPGDWQPVKAGAATNALAALWVPFVIAYQALSLSPEACRSDAYPLGIAILTVALLVTVTPTAVIGGAIVGWLGAQLTRVKGGSVALGAACVLVLSVSLAMLLYQPPGSGVKGVVTAPQCSNTASGSPVCVIRPAPKTEVTVVKTDSDHVAGSAITDASGRYQISLPPGQYRIWAAIEAAKTGLVPITITQGQYLTVELDAR